MSEAASQGSHPRDRLRRVLSLNDATMLIVASVVGSGIFLTPGAVADRLPHPGVFLAAWLLGGLLSLAGALANAELGAMFPRAGGDYVYLREAFHPLAGFLVGWLSFFVIFAGTVATLAVAFADSLAPRLRPRPRDARSARDRDHRRRQRRELRRRALGRAREQRHELREDRGAARLRRARAAARPRERGESAAGLRGRRRHLARPRSASRSPRSCSRTWAGTPRCTWRARSSGPSATCRPRSSSASGSARCST